MQTTDPVRNSPPLAVLTTAAILALTFTGCSRDSGESPAPSTGPAAEPASQAAAPAPAAAEPDELIPRTLLFGNPERIRGRLSPSGELVSYVAPVDGIMNVWVGPANDLEAAKPVTADTSRGIQVYQWSASDDYLLYLRDTGGDENDHVHAVSLATGEIRDLTPYPGARAEIYAVSWSRPGEIVVGINDRNPEYFDVYRIALETGERTLLLENDEFGSFVADDDLAVRIAVRPTEDGGGDVFRVDPGDDGPAFTQISNISAEDFLSTTMLGMTPANDAIHVITARDRDKAALMAMSLEDGSLSLVAEDDRADVDAVMREPTTREVLAYAATFERQTWFPLQDGFGRHLENIVNNTPGDMNLLGQTRDGNRWIFVSDAPDDPVPYYVYDRTTEETRRLFSSYPELAAMPLRTMTPVVIESRDGLPLVSYLTLPANADPDGDGRADARSPLVLNVHGGPWARDTFGYNPTHQWLANRGYAVLSVNYRGSTGFGKAFVEAAVGEWAGKMHDDLLDAVDWAVVEGITDPGTVAIMGGSYGGYATLVGLTFTPQRFACGVDIVGPSNLQTLLGTIPPYWKSFFETFARHLGDPRTQEGRALLQDRSPLNRVDAISRPLLIGQGANDPRVKQSESDQIVEVMTRKNLPVTYVLFPDEGHGFARPQNRLAFFGITEGFLHTCLGGRFQPLGNALAGSSTQVPAGADIVPGLSAALEGFEPTVLK
jgi:dipeptidyl aminopeptidase/acylaminoacyl peptidase